MSEDENDYTEENVEVLIEDDGDELGESADIDVVEEALEASEGDFVLDNEQIISIVESALYVNDKPMTVGQIKAYFKGTPVKSSEIRKALKSLAEDLSEKRRGVQLVEIEAGLQLRTKIENAQFLRGQVKPRVFRLSQAALEVLSIIAYKQPCTKFMVDEVRGVESGHLLRALLERGLLDFAGKSELPGKPMYYATTKKFMEIFGLRSLEELPSMGEIDQLLPEGIDEFEAEEQKKETLSDITEKMSEGAVASYSQGEEELEKISSLLGQIDTSSEFFEQEKAKMRARRDEERAQNIREALEVGESVPDAELKWFKKHEAKIAAEAVVEAAPIEEIAPVEEVGVEATDSIEAATADDDINDDEFANDQFNTVNDREPEAEA